MTWSIIKKLKMNDSKMEIRSPQLKCDFSGLSVRVMKTEKVRDFRVILIKQ